MYKMATAGVPRGTILAVHLQKCSHLSIFFFASSFKPSGKQLPPQVDKSGCFPAQRAAIVLLYFCQCFIGYLPCGGKLGCFPEVQILANIL